MGTTFSSPMSMLSAGAMFPAPRCSYDKTISNYIEIPKNTDYGSSWRSKQTDFIPALLFQNRQFPSCIIYSHGNGEDIGHTYGWLKTLHETLNINVLAYDYEGYGLHTGSSSENNCNKNLDTVLNYVRNSLRFPLDQIIVYGRSLGTGPTVNLAAKTSGLKGVILEAPYTSIFGIVSQTAATISTCSDPFRNESKVYSIKSPMIIFHGTQDEVIPFEHGVRLHQLSNCHIVPLPGGHHNDLIQNFRHTILSNIRNIFEN